MSQFDSVLLAAGRGTRLRPLTEAIPKPALPLLDVALGAHPLAALALLGGPLFVNLSPRAELVRAALAPACPRAEFVVEAPEPFGSAGTLHALRQRLTGPVVTRNADALTDVSIPAAIETHTAAGTAVTIVTAAVAEGADLVAEEGRATRFVDRRRGSVPGELWLGISILEPKALDLIGPDRPLDLATGLLAPLVARGEVAVHRHDGYFLDVGTVARYLTATQDVLDGRIDLPFPPPGRMLEVDGGRAYVGPAAQVQERSLRAGAVVLAGAIVPDDAIVERAIVWPGKEVPGGTQVTGGVWAFGALQQ